MKTIKWECKRKGCVHKVCTVETTSETDLEKSPPVCVHGIPVTCEWEIMFTYT